VLLQVGKISFTGSPMSVLGHLLDHVQVLPISLAVAISAPALGLPHGDQFDRILAATAKAHKLVLITKDANIVGAGIVPTVWCGKHHEAQPADKRQPDDRRRYALTVFLINSGTVVGPTPPETGLMAPLP